ncbi:MAG: choline-sulfatase [Pseudomonadota bacterium]
MSLKSQASQRSQPSILMIQADQLSASALSCYGNSITQTPHLDRLAGEGAVFEEAYCNYPLCAPSRFSMMTGQLASRIAAYDNGAEFPAGIPTFAHYLRAAGYRTCLSGKMHFIGPDQLHGYDQRLTSDIYPSDFVWAANWDEARQRDTNGPGAVTVAGPCQESVQIQYDDQVAAQACDWLEQCRDDDRPFLLTVSFTHPHDPFVCGYDDWALYEGVEIPLPETPQAQDPHSQKILQQFGMADITFSDAEIVRARRGYYGSVSYFDRKIGQVLAALEASGRAENTIVLVTADHGEMLGEQGLWMKKVFFENAIKVPLIFWRPGRIAAKRISGLVSLVDLLPTLMGLAGQDTSDGEGPVEPVDGLDLTPALWGSEDLPERPLRAELTCEGSDGPVLLLRRGSLKYIWSTVDPPLLFDLETDPNEVENLAGRTEWAEREAALLSDVTALWEPQELARAVRLSQVRRGLITRAHKTVGTPPDWDYRESVQPDSRWMRGETSYNDWAFSSIIGLEK